MEDTFSRVKLLPRGVQGLYATWCVTYVRITCTWYVRILGERLFETRGLRMIFVTLS